MLVAVPFAPLNIERHSCCYVLSVMGSSCTSPFKQEILSFLYTHSHAVLRRSATCLCAHLPRDVALFPPASEIRLHADRKRTADRPHCRLGCIAATAVNPLNRYWLRRTAARNTKTTGTDQEAMQGSTSCLMNMHQQSGESKTPLCRLVTTKSTSTTAREVRQAGTSGTHLSSGREELVVEAGETNSSKRHGSNRHAPPCIASPALIER